MQLMLLASRGLASREDRSNSSANSKHTCPTEHTTGPDIVPFIGNLNYHQFSTILSGACAAFSALIVFVLIALHAFNYSNPVQQRQIIRIVLLIPWVALFAFLIVWRADAGEYLVESLDFGCSIVLSSFLLFMCDLVLSHHGGFDDLFGQGAWARGAFNGESPQVLKKMWYGVLQFIPMSIILWIATAVSIAVGTYCKQSNSVHFAHIWLKVLEGIITTYAIICSLRFYGKNKAKLLKHRIILKLFTFKGVIGLNALQNFIISILSGHGVLKPTKYMTYHDTNTGLASLILACEMLIFAILLTIAFPVSPYKNQGGPAAGPLTAIVDALNISDLLSAFVRGPMRLVRAQQMKILRQVSIRIGGAASPVSSNYESGTGRMLQKPRMTLQKPRMSTAV